MKAKPRTILILASTLMIGMLLGALLHAQFFDKRVKRMHRMSTPEGFVESYIGTIQPTDPEQDTAIRAILSEHSIQVHKGFQEHREAFHTSLVKMREALAPLLSEEQTERLQERADRRGRK